MAEGGDLEQNSASKAPSTKLEEQATAKADLSYSYWATHHLKGNGGSPATSIAAAAPRKLTDEEARALQEAERKGSSTAASAWNQAGTFEERCVTEWAKGRLKEMLVGVQSGSVTTSDVTSITGDANIWFVRGKKRCGFDFEITLSWRADVAGDGEDLPATAAVTGDVKLPSACSDDLEDLHLEAMVTTGGSGAEKAAALADAKGLRQPLTEVLCAFHEELKGK